MTTAAQRPRLTDEQLVELLALLQDSDSVELKLTVPEDYQRSAIASLGIDALEGQIRQVFFLDTPDLRLNAAGVVVRVRRVQGKRADSVVKLRPVVPSELPSRLRRSANFRVEVDAMPGGGFVCSGSMKGIIDNREIRETVAASLPPRRLFSKEQRRFFREYAPDGLKLDDLSFLGPIFVLKAQWSPRADLPRMVAEMWLYPDGSRVLELSTKCLPNTAFQVAAEARSLLHGHGIEMSGEQHTKTKQALSFFATPASTHPN